MIRQEMQAEELHQLQSELMQKITLNIKLIEDLKMKEAKMWERHEADIAFKLQCQEWSIFLLKYLTLIFASFIMFIVGEKKA